MGVLSCVPGDDALLGPSVLRVSPRRLACRSCTVRANRIEQHNGGAVTRYPLQPLLDMAGMTLNELRQVCPMNGPVYHNARTLGLTEAQADRWACKVGLVPWLIWPDWLDDALVECAEPSCDVRFVPSRKTNIYCSRACMCRTKNREAQRRRYQTDPAFREAKKAANRGYYVEAARSIQMKSSRWREANPDRARENQRRYYAENKARIREQQAEYKRRRREAA